MPESSSSEPSQGLWVVCQLGARMHYAVPRLLYEQGLLEHFHTDICSGPRMERMLRWLPSSWQPAALKRLLDRVPESLPHNLITTYPIAGTRYFLKQRSARTVEEQSEVHLWMGRKFGECVTRHGFGEGSAVYTFNTAALEILRAARDKGMVGVVEQTIAPRAYEEELLAEEEQRFPGWSASPRVRGRFTQETIAREAAEWNHADLIICGSSFVKEGIARCGGPVDRCAVVPYGVDARFAPIHRAPHQGPLRVLTVGEVCLRKGAAYVAELAARLKGAAEFRWVGPVSLSAGRTREFAGTVSLTGAVPRSQVVPHYEWADVFFLPTICEGSATVIYEALQTGLPVVTTPNAGSVVRDGSDGFIVPIRDVAAMEERLRQLAEDRNLLSEMSAETAHSRSTVSLEAYERRLLQVLRAAKVAPTRHAEAKSNSASSGQPQVRAAVSAIVTAWGRTERTIATLRKLQECQPAPAEILVHVDGNQLALAAQLRTTFPGITVLFSAERLGPGGSRNVLLRAAREELVASFDDDSYPADANFFARVADIAASCPGAAVIMATLLDGTGDMPPPPQGLTRVATFVGAGCIYRKSAFLQTTGYVPLPLAYGMEEVDLSIRVHEMGREIVHAPELRVVHDVGPLKEVRRIEFRGFWPRLVDAQEPAHRDTPEISAGMVANLALLPFLRYPVVLWPYGFAQCLHKALELMVNGRGREAITGLCSIPSLLWRHRDQRAPLPTTAVLSFLRLRRDDHKSSDHQPS